MSRTKDRGIANRDHTTVVLYERNVLCDWVIRFLDTNTANPKACCL